MCNRLCNFWLEADLFHTKSSEKKAPPKPNMNMNFQFADVLNGFFLTYKLHSNQI